MEKWEVCAKTLKTAAKRVLGTQQNNNNKDWFNEECREATGGKIRPICVIKNKIEEPEPQ